MASLRMFEARGRRSFQRKYRLAEVESAYYMMASSLASDGDLQVLPEDSERLRAAAVLLYLLKVNICVR